MSLLKSLSNAFSYIGNGIKKAVTYPFRYMKETGFYDSLKNTVKRYGMAGVVLGAATGLLGAAFFFYPAQILMASTLINGMGHVYLIGTGLADIYNKWQSYKKGNYGKGTKAALKAIGFGALSLPVGYFLIYPTVSGFVGGLIGSAGLLARML